MKGLEKSIDEIRKLITSRAIMRINELLDMASEEFWSRELGLQKRTIAKRYVNPQTYRRKETVALALYLNLKEGTVIRLINKEIVEQKMRAREGQPAK